MRLRDSKPTPPAAPWRALAGLLALLVLTLALAAWSPTLHDWLHGENGAHSSSDTARHDDGCPVIHFSQGLVGPDASTTLTTPIATPAARYPDLPRSPVSTAPARLYPPAHAPPR